MKIFAPTLALVISGVAVFQLLQAQETPKAMGSGTHSAMGDQGGSATKTDNMLSPNEYTELGMVRWHRNFDQAVALSKKTQKPLAILFQEVPGCAGCQQYGRQVLSHPTVVETLEDRFIPVVVFNNQGGRDKQILTQFKEPAWNYQVMRFTDHNLRELIPRKDHVWTVSATMDRVNQALNVAKRSIPEHLNQVYSAETNPNLQTAVFAMYCFWTGEAKLGALDGVISTEAGFYDGREVVVVRYDPKTINIVSLTKTAASIDCAHAVYLPNDQAIKAVTGTTRLTKLARYNSSQYRKAPRSDQKRQLQSLKGLDQLNLTPMQWTKLNATTVSRDPFAKWLSPQQLSQLKALNAK
ncbi:MAG: VPGUxxT family thioredoxin-like (seleno)protein, type 2 [Fuerstiella sp.]